MRVKIIVILLFVLSSWFTARLSAQSTSVELSYSNKFYDHSFYEQLPSRNMIRPAESPHWIGIQAIEYMRVGSASSWYGFPALVSFQLMLPYTITINDSIHAKIRGFNLGLPIAGIDLLKSKKADLLVIGGVNVGRLRLSGDDRVGAKNPFISPKLLVMPRIGFGRIIISAMAEYSYDVSGSSWKDRFSGAKHTAAIQPFRQSGLTLSLSTGVRFNY